MLGLSAQNGKRVKNQKLSCKLYLSDEGYGHIVRQRAVMEELRRHLPDLDVTLQTKTQIATAARFIPNTKLIDRFNNIRWDKKENGSPDLEAIKDRYSKYIQTSEDFIKMELAEYEYDFSISDFVYEAFEVARYKNKPSFGIAHFTWDWFFSKLYPPSVHTDVVYHLLRMSANATRIYFPPFTPEEIIHYYKGKAIEVPLILKKSIEHKVIDSQSRFKVMIMDSGTGILSEAISNALKSVKGLSEFLFFVSEKQQTEQDNVAKIAEKELMVDYIADMDLVIGRAGFNTISECIGLRTPMLLIGEAMNPELNENILMLKKQNLGSFISLDTFENGLDKFLPDFIKHEYGYIRKMMTNHEIGTNGSEVIVNDMLNYL